MKQRIRLDLTENQAEILGSLLEMVLDEMFHECSFGSWHRNNPDDLKDCRLLFKRLENLSGDGKK